MDALGNVLGGLGSTIGGLFSGILGAVGGAAREALHAFGSVVSVAWLPIVAIALIALLAWNVARR